MKDLTIIYYTANKLKPKFAENTLRILKEAIGDTPVVSVSKQPMDFGLNIVTDTPSSYLNIYHDILIGAQAADTKYIALAEDDVLYHADHFKYRPRTCPFAYNIGVWCIYTWINPPIFSYRGQRHNNGALICEREAFIKAMEERFRKYPVDSMIDLRFFAEIGKYEDHLGVTQNKIEEFYTHPANIMFSHYEAQGYERNGENKRLGFPRALVIPYWGTAQDIMDLYV